MLETISADQWAIPLLAGHVAQNALFCQSKVLPILKADPDPFQCLSFISFLSWVPLLLILLFFWKYIHFIILIVPIA